MKTVSLGEVSNISMMKCAFQIEAFESKELTPIIFNMGLTHLVSEATVCSEFLAI